MKRKRSGVPGISPPPPGPNPLGISPPSPGPNPQGSRPPCAPPFRDLAPPPPVPTKHFRDYSCIQTQLPRKLLKYGLVIYLTMDLRESNSEPMLSDIFKMLELTSQSSYTRLQFCSCELDFVESFFTLPTLSIVSWVIQIPKGERDQLSVT